MNLRSVKSASTPRRQPNTGSSSKFVSYHASRQTQENSKPQPRSSFKDKAPNVSKSLRDPARLPIILVGILVILSIGYSTTLTSSARLVVTKANKTPQLRSSSEYQSRADELLGSSVLNRNKLSINTNDVTTKLKQDFPEIEDVQVVLPLMGHRPIVELSLASPAIILASQNGVFVVDVNGIAIASLNQLSSGAVLNIPTLREEADLDLKLGKPVLSKQDVAFVTTISNQFSANKLQIESLNLPPLASELRVQLKDKKYFIKMSLSSDPRLAAGQYIAFHKDKVASGEVKPNEYVDVRVEERVYFK